MNTVAQETRATDSAPSGAIRNVLVVDDSKVQLRILESVLRSWGYEVSTAESGVHALEVCKTQIPDLVISDWMMPEMNGLEFCAHFRAMTQDRYGYFILLTSKSEKDEIARGLDAGADDFLSKPVNADELRARINAGARILTMERELSAKNLVISETLEELQKVYEGIENDLKQARNIQQALVPERHRQFGRSSISLLLEPCGHVGGDLVGMFSAEGSQVGFYNIDISGHGITSALVSARMAGYFAQGYPDHNIGLEKRPGDTFTLRPPEAVAVSLNQRLAMDQGVSEYLTMVYATLCVETGQLQLVQAGHPPPLLMRASGETVFVGEGGLPVGLIDGATYSQVSCQLEPGDRLLLYSDGFSECIMRDGSMLEEEGLADLATSFPKGMSGTEYLDDLLRTLRSNSADPNAADDDVSAVLLEFNPG